MMNCILVLQLHQAAAEPLKSNIDMVLNESPGAIHTPLYRLFGWESHLHIHIDSGEYPVSTASKAIGFYQIVRWFF